MPHIDQKLEIESVKLKSDAQVLKDLGQTIHANRIKQGFSQEELSRRSGISRYYISSIERGAKNVTVTVLRKLATVLDLKAWQILHGAEEL
jgi:transcriptional regulator with XRE-family HTH domain